MTDNKTITIDREFLERQLAVGLEYLWNHPNAGKDHLFDAGFVGSHVWNNAAMLPQNLDTPEDKDDLCPCCSEIRIKRPAITCPGCTEYHSQQEGAKVNYRPGRGLFEPLLPPIDLQIMSPRVRDRFHQIAVEQLRWEAAIAAAKEVMIQSFPGWEYGSHRTWRANLCQVSKDIFEVMSAGPPKGEADDAE